MAASLCQLLFGAHAHNHLEGYEIPWNFLQNHGYSFTQMMEVQKKEANNTYFLQEVCNFFPIWAFKSHRFRKLEQAGEEI